MYNLIFLEGISGTGKSTLAAMLCGRLRGLGKAARCTLEGDANSPLDLFCTAYLQGGQYEELLRLYPAYASVLRECSLVEPEYVLLKYHNLHSKLPPELYGYLKDHEFCHHPKNPPPLSQYSQVFLRLWARFFKDAIVTSEILIFDGSLLHHQVNDLMGNYAAAKAQAAAHLSALIETVRPLNPAIFYLSTGDAAATLSRARQRRGQAPPTGEQTAFWQQRLQMDAWLLKALPIRSWIFDVSCGNWDIALEQMMLHAAPAHSAATYEMR